MRASLEPRRAYVLDALEAAQVAQRLEAFEPAQVLWVGDAAPAPFEARSTSEVRRMLGRSVHAVVLEREAALDADGLGRIQGMLVSGGALLLWEPVAPGRFADRVRAMLAEPPFSPLPEGPLSPPSPVTVGTADQRAAVDALSETMSLSPPTLSVLLAGRGRGKSSALGQALGRLEPTQRVAIVGPSRDSIAEVLRFSAALDHRDATDVLTPLEVALAEARYDVIVVDEAAQIPVPLLRQILARHPAAHLAFASTTHGYEGTGRGFVLRFLERLREDPRPLRSIALEAPIRYPADDPLERAVFDALLLDARPREPSKDAEWTYERLDRGALARDEARLSAVFGLLVHAHYQTRPSDLARLLDAPDLSLHVMRSGGHVGAVCLVSEEGELSDETVRALARGQRLRGSALVETLVCHSGALEAAEMRWARSVRIAVHPSLRRAGLASRLAEHIHRSLDVDAFGTLFGATPALIAFRRSLGYRLVRLGASRGGRTGEPSAIMVRPVSARATALVTRLRAELARDLSLQRELARADVPLAADPAFERALRETLPPPRALTTAERDAIVAQYAEGPRTYEASAVAIAAWLSDRSRATLSAEERAMIEARVDRSLGWRECAKCAGVSGPRAAMRLLRRAIRALRSAPAQPASGGR